MSSVINCKYARAWALPFVILYPILIPLPLSTLSLYPGHLWPVLPVGEGFIKTFQEFKGPRGATFWAVPTDWHSGETNVLDWSPQQFNYTKHTIPPQSSMATQARRELSQCGLHPQCNLMLFFHLPETQKVSSSFNWHSHRPFYPAPKQADIHYSHWAQSSLVPTNTKMLGFVIIFR